MCADGYWVVMMSKDSVRNDEAVTADVVGSLLREARVKAGLSVI